MLRPAVTCALLVSTAAASTNAQRSIDWTQVDHAMGKTGAMQPGDVYRYAFPRSDLHVTVDGVPLKPALALGGWVAFKATGDNEAIAMGDLVLRDDEVNPVMLKLREGGVEQTALHNHLLRESPTIMYMHIHAQGDPTHIASAIHAALALTATPFTAPPPPAPTPGPAPLDTTAIATALGRSGKLNGTVYQVTVPRSESIQMDGMTVPPAMGVATGINIQAVSSDKAVTTGDFVLTAAEVNPVIQALTEHGIAVTAVHSHMLTEEPRLFFMHFWGNADAVTLARGLRAALDKTNSKGS
ncbi:MAG TPA: DUF1259 domain-containing protein [Gemmatimonadaceae bacterium]|nr:DUF1259 domain-containing protein [Gemmatimonadaceae bacterium]